MNTLVISKEAQPQPAIPVPEEISSVAADSRRALLDRPLLLTFLLALLGALCLQLWRPLFHFTDDTLSGWLPVVLEASRKLWTGQWPLVNDSLFGGHYDFLRDPTVFGLLSPTIVGFSWLAMTDFWYLLPDAVGTVNLILIALAFAWSAIRLRESLSLEYGNGLVVLCSLSYAFTPFNFVVGASWIGFVNPQASLPILVAAMLDRSTRRGIIAVFVALLYGLLGSHLHPFLFCTGFASLLSVALAISQRTWEPVRRLMLGGLAAFVVLAPLLWWAILGFNDSSRSSGLSAETARLFRLPPLMLTQSFVLGPLASGFSDGLDFYFGDPLFNLGIAFSAANVPFLWTLVRKRSFAKLDAIVLGFALLAALIIIRPAAIAATFSHIPLLSSLRWPFRELPLLFFCVHLFILLNSPRRLPGSTAIAWVSGTLVFAILFLAPAPTFNTLALDRRLILSGKAQRFWHQLTKGERVKIVSAAPPAAVFLWPGKVPFALLGAYNYACILGVQNTSGYSPTLPGSKFDDKLKPYHHAGMFTPKQAASIRQIAPDVMTMTLIHLDPVVIEVNRKGQIRQFLLEPKTDVIREVRVQP